MNESSVLMVDDDSASIKLMIRMLAGVSAVQFATNGSDALRLAREARPALVLLDARMPGLSGYEVCEAAGGACQKRIAQALTRACLRPADSRFSELLRAADEALCAARSAGRAQAWMLDVANANVPTLAHEVVSPNRSRAVIATPGGQLANVAAHR